ncbi:MAG: bidirectional hydrogenase complex protein HoxE [bacterium]
MQTELIKPVIPSDDKRWKMVNATMRKHGYHPQALIEVLHSVQEMFGYLDDEAFRFIASSLHVPLSQVYGVATFYHFFKMKPQGQHSCVVCTGTACYIKGAGEILAAIENEFGVKPDETTEDGKLSVLTARCVGACGLAPVVVLDGEVAGKLTATQVVEKIWRMTRDDT